MEIKLNKLTLTNFKGVSNLEVEFGDVTNIQGANETGKTTLMDGWSWLLFGKDSSGSDNFWIKPRDSEGDVLARTENKVKGQLKVDGRDVVLEKIHREKWQTKKGDTEPTFTGHETKHFIDEVPVNASDYQEKIKSMIDEEIFRLITSTRYFPNLHWKKKREMLFNLIQDVRTLDALHQYEKETGEKLDQLAEQLNSGKTLDELQKSINGKKRTIQKELDEKKPRISENKDKMPEEKNWQEIEQKFNQKNKELNEVNSEIENINISYRQKNKELQDIWSNINQIEFEISEAKKAHLKDKQEESERKGNQRQELNSKLNRKKSDKEGIEGEIKEKQAKYEELEQKIKELRGQWNEEKNRQLDFDEMELVCDKCGGLGKIKKGEVPEQTEDLETQKEKAKEKFNQEKAKKLQQINEEGKAKKEELNKLDEEISNKKEELSKLSEEISKDEQEISNLDKSINRVLDEIKEREQVNETDVAPEKVKERDKLKQEAQNFELPDISELKEKREKIQNELQGLRDQLNEKKEREKIQKRIQELEKQEKELSQQKADLEKQEIHIDGVTEKKIEMTEKKVNALFDYVQFQMFDRQVNGQIVETCKILIKGVQYSDANNGSQIIAGLDIINTFSKYYEVFAPIFIDNREAVTNFPYSMTNSQLICLIVDENYDKLNVEIKK